MTIEDMEKYAREEFDGCFNQRVKGKWLEVQYKIDHYKYFYNNKQISYQKAIELLK